jgi:hypothetical protein
MGSLDLSSEPDGADRPELAEVGAGHRPRSGSRELPDPDERGRLYEVTRTHVDADAAEQTRETGQNEQSYHAAVPRFLRMWADHLDRWPDERRTTAPADNRSPDQPGSYRSDGGFYLSPDRNAEADQCIARVREAETSISADIQTIARETTAGAHLEGFDHRLKGDTRLKEKIADGLTTSTPDATPEDVLREIPDAIRYTFCLSSDSYTRGYFEIKGRLEDLGYEMYHSRNSWTNPEYRGVNTRWITQEGQRFEVQLHTADSFHAKQHVTHGSYERIRNSLTTRAELSELHTFQQEVSAAIEIPARAAEIPNYKKEVF